MSQLEEAVRRALDEIPGSLRALAREAGVSHSLLVRIRIGDRAATREVAEALANALGRWAGRCSSAEGLLRDSLSQEVDE
jgi:transcriptional regulator with XRE-family HTH domain